MKQKLLFFFLTAFLSLIGGGELWADGYIPSGIAKKFTVTTDIIVAGTGESTANSVIAAGKTENWITIPSEKYSPKTPLPDSEIDTPTSNVYCLQVKADGNTFNAKNRVIHFKVTGVTGVKAIGQANSDRGFQIGATEVTSNLNENSSMNIVAGNSPAQNPVSYSGLDKSKTYIISIFAYSSDTYLYAVRFISDPYVTNIGIGDLCYAVGTQGSNSSSNGLDRTVGGFSLTFGGGDGVKYNGSNQLLVRTKNATSGTITIALDANNSKKNIKKVVFTKSSAGDGTFTASSGNTTLTNSETTITWEGAACKTITFTESGPEFYITNIAITTDVTPVFEKVTPTVTISPTSASVKKATAGTFTTTATSSPKNFNWTWTPTSLANVEYYTKNDGGTKTANQLGTPGTFETTSASTTTGNNTLVASFAGNDFFNAVADAATYTLTVSAPVESSPDNTVQTYPYTWDFTAGSTTWGNSSTQLPISDWAKGDETYYNYSVPNTETGFNIDAIKGLRFQSINYLGLDWEYGHIWSTAGTITIPNVPAGMTIKIVAQNRNDSNPATTITPTNATYTGEGTATLGTEYTTYTFTKTATGTDVSFAFSGNSSIKSIAVLKTAITRFNFKGSGNSTTYVYDSNNPTISPVLIIAPSGAASNKSLFTVTNSTDTEVIAIANSGCSSINGNNINFGNSLRRGKPGTSDVTFTFAGNDAYEPATFTVTYTINKQTPTVTFDTGIDQTIAYSEDTYTDAATASNEKTVTYTSSNTSVATVSDGGVVTFHNSGVTMITASVEGDEYYNAASASYTLTVNGSTTPELTWTWTDDSNFPDLRGSKLAYGNNAYCFATATGTTAPVQYKSSNTKIATVAVEEHGGQANACKITPTGNGEVTITAYVEGSGNVNPAEVSFTMTIEGQEVHMSFQPTSGTVKVGKTITPYISVPDIKMEDITSVTVTTSDASKATVTAGETTETLTTYTLTTANGGLTSYTKDNTEYLEHIYATIKGEAVTSDAVTITVTVNSDIYKPTTATYQVTVNDEDLNFNWKAPSQTYTLYTGDYMMIPAITGNANGNWSYSKGSTCESEQAYLYDIKSGTPTWNNRDFKIGEGIPDYRLYESDGTTVTDKAYIVWVNGQSVHTDVLMIYAKTAGTVKLHAKDPQTGASPVNITINIINKSTLTSATTSYVNNMSFPYTWSFVGESSIATVSPNYWEDKGDYYTCGMSTAFNFDYCDEDNDGNTGEALKGKYFVDENGIMPQFYGMTVEFGNSGDKNHSYKAKEDKLRLYKYDSNKPDQPLLQVVGGTHKIALPAPGAGCPSNYKLFVKARSRKDPARDAILQAYWSDSKKPYYSFTNNDPIIFSVDVTSGDPVKELWVSDVDIYWIAMSTEAKELSYFIASNPNLKYAAAAYSYNEDLDLTKSNEVNGATAYYASSFTVDKDTQGDYSDTDATDYAVVMKPLSNLGSYVKAKTGMLLKYDDVDGITADTKIPFYMIANPRNVKTYDADETIDGTTHKNYLVGTGATTPTIGRTTTIGGTTYTNFMMSAAYKYYADVTDPNSVQGGYHFDRDWSFYPVMNTGAVAAQKSYLQIPGDLYVNRNGEIVVMPTSARAAFDVESAADDTAEAPATKAALSIVFDDSVPATPEDPATEEPEDEDGDSVIDKDRPRKPGDDGWPKPPFPPIIITDIDNVKTNEADNAVWHSMEGVRISQPTKPGLYIRNGKKVVIK